MKEYLSYDIRQDIGVERPVLFADTGSTARPGLLSPVEDLDSGYLDAYTAGKADLQTENDNGILRPAGRAVILPLTGTNRPPRRAMRAARGTTVPL